jgi:hypothetical protein
MNLPEQKETLKAYDAFISDGVGWANEITETGHQLFLIGESAKAKEMYYLALSMRGDCEEQTILAEHAFQDFKDLDLTIRCLEEAELAWLQQIISFSDSDHTELSDIIIEYSKDSHSQLVSSKALKTIDTSYDWEKSLIFFGDDGKGEPIRNGTPIDQASNFRERIIELRRIIKS